MYINDGDFVLFAEGHKHSSSHLQLSRGMIKLSTLKDNFVLSLIFKLYVPTYVCMYVCMYACKSWNCCADTKWTLNQI